MRKCKSLFYVAKITYINTLNNSDCYKYYCYSSFEELIEGENCIKCLFENVNKNYVCKVENFICCVKITHKDLSYLIRFDNIHDKKLLKKIEKNLVKIVVV